MVEQKRLQRAELERRFSEAVLCQEQGQDQQAVALYNQVLPYKIKEFEIYANLGILFRKHGDVAQALRCYEKLIQLKPMEAEFYYILGVLYCSEERMKEGQHCLEQAVALDSGHWQAGLALAKIFFNEEQFKEAEQYFRIALEIKPDIVDAFVCLCQIYRSRNELEQAIFYCRKAAQQEPDSPAIHGFLADLELRTGNWYEGFISYEWRKKLAILKDYFAPLEQVTQWQGELFTGKKLLVCYEQGLGDTLQFVRYLPQVKQRGGFVTLYCQSAVQRLLQSVSGADVVTDQVNLLEHDLIVPLLTLPRIFATTPNTVPNEIPYIHPLPEWTKPWQERIGEQRKLKVGLVWSGNTYNNTIVGRSCRLEDMLPLAQVKNVQFYSLQKGEAAEQIQDVADTWSVIDYTEEIHDFADTAGLISQLDLVISIDTSVPHLVGAMEKPVWIAMPFVSEWRWLSDREDTPWYPTARLFRQPKENDWHSVFVDMAEQLGKVSTKWLRSKGEYDDRWKKW